jgi:hypothetical protein
MSNGSKFGWQKRVRGERIRRKAGEGVRKREGGGMK